MFAVVPYDEYVALRELAEDAGDTAVLLRYPRRYAIGREETIPVELADRLLAGESPLRVWREHRRMTGADLAQRVDVTPAHISKLESAKGEPSVTVLRRIGKALAVELELLVGADDGP